MAKSRERDSNRAIVEDDRNSPVDCYGARVRVGERCEPSESLNNKPPFWVDIFLAKSRERDSNRAIVED